MGGKRNDYDKLQRKYRAQDISEDRKAAIEEERKRVLGDGYRESCRCCNCDDDEECCFDGSTWVECCGECICGAICSR